MKKITLIIAALLLAQVSCISFTSCTDSKVAPGNTQVQDKKENTVTQKQDTTDSTKNDTSDIRQKDKTDASPVFYIDGELPDIGEFSGTSERFYKEYTPNFIPSDEYGKVIPYIGSYRTFSNNETKYPINIGYSSYGLCTVDGRIVMDASDAVRNITCMKTNDGFCFYTMSITENQELETEDDIYLPQKTVILPESGKWSIELGNNAWINEARNGVICVSKYNDFYGSGECILYDYDGNEISRLGEYDNVVLSDMGLLGVDKWDETDFHAYIDKDGNVVLGPYKAVNPFNHKGIANIENEDGWHLIDTTGKKLTKQPYDSIVLHKKDYSLDEPSVFVAKHKDNRYRSDIYSCDGKYLATVEGTSYFSVRFPKNGDIIYYYTDRYGDDMIWKRVSDGSDLVSKECGKAPNSYSGDENIYLYEDKETGTGYIFDAEGETILKAEEFMELHQISKDSRYFVYSCGNYEEYYDEDSKQHLTRPNRTLYLFDTETGTNTKLPTTFPEGSATFFGDDCEYILIGTYNTESFFGDWNSYALYDIKNDRLLFEGSKFISFHAWESDYFTVCTKNTCTLYDSDLNAIIKIYND